jgi:hypothetical protein
MKVLTPEEFEKLEKYDKLDYEKALIDNKKFIEELKVALAEFNSYDYGMDILDTDYDKYLLSYHCREETIKN